MYSDQSKQPASNYTPRAAAVLQQIFDKILRPGGTVLNIKWKEPTPEMFRRYAHELPEILNWFAQAGIRHGIPMRTFENKPLCEEDLTELENLFANMKSIIIEDDKKNEKYCMLRNKQNGHTVVLTNTGNIMAINF